MYPMLEDDHFLRINVQDSGIGMNEEKVQQILQEHSNIESQRGTNYEKGTGIGLQLCRDLVTLNKGRFGIESIPEKGSIFWFSLPTEPQAEEKNPA